MRALLPVLIVTTLTGPAYAQNQAAGADGGDADGAFQALIDKCDNTDILFLRAKTRLLLGRTTDDAAAQAQKLIDEGMAKCGEGDIETAESKINEGFEIAQAGVTEKLGADATETAATENAPEAESQSADAEETKPWWKFW